MRPSTNLKGSQPLAGGREHATRDPNATDQHELIWGLKLYAVPPVQFRIHVFPPLGNLLVEASGFNTI